MEGNPNTREEIGQRSSRRGLFIFLWSWFVSSSMTFRRLVDFVACVCCGWSDGAWWGWSLSSWKIISGIVLGEGYNREEGTKQHQTASSWSATDQQLCASPEDINLNHFCISFPSTDQPSKANPGYLNPNQAQFLRQRIHKRWDSSGSQVFPNESFCAIPVESRCGVTDARQVYRC